MILFYFTPERNGADSCCLVFCFDEDSLVVSKRGLQ